MNREQKTTYVNDLKSVIAANEGKNGCSKSLHALERYRVPPATLERPQLLHPWKAAGRRIVLSICRFLHFLAYVFELHGSGLLLAFDLEGEEVAEFLAATALVIKPARHQTACSAHGVVAPA